MAYIGRTTDGFGVRQRFLFTPDAGATSVSGTDASGATLTFSDSVYMDVFLNGVLLKAGTDYNTNTANTIAGLTATVANDEVTVLVYDIFTTADMVSATSGGTFTGNVTHSGDLTINGTTTLSGPVTFDSSAPFYTISSNSILRFRDSGIGINSSADGQLDIDADTEVEITTTTVDLNGALDVSGTSTLNDDVTFTGANYNVVWDKSDDALEFADSAKAVFGTGSDLQIYHDGSNSYIDDAGTGSLFLRSNDIKLHKYTGENLITATADAEVGLYYDDSLKFKTASTGVEIFNGASGQSPHIILKDMNSGVVAGDFGGSLRFSTNDSNAQGVSAVIASSYANAAGGTNISFFTGTGGNTSEKMRLHTDGCLMLGYPESGLTAPAYTNRAFEAYSSTDNVYMALFHNKSTGSLPYGFFIAYDQSPDNHNANFIGCTDGTTARFVVANDGDVTNHDNSYGAISDERIKQDIVDANSQWDDIKNIKVRNFKKKDDVAQYGDKAWSQIGVVAQELEKVSPKLIRESLPTASDIKHNAEFGTLYEDGDTIPEGKEVGDVKEIKANVKQVSYSVLYMKAVKALQETMSRVETLEAEVKALKEA